jgi:hypothetical protein
LKRYTTVGIDYYFSHFDFTRAFGGSDIHSLGLNYAVRLSRNWELALRVGADRVENLFLTRVTIDPAVAAILGQSVGVVVAHQMHYFPDLQGRLSRRFEHASFEVRYSRKVNAGNGVFLTSNYQSVSALYSYTGIRHWNFGINAGYSSMGAIMQNLGNYEGYQGGLGITREVVKGLHIVGRFDARTYHVLQAQYSRRPYRATLGLAWAPGDMPLSFW